MYRTHTVSQLEFKNFIFTAVGPCRKIFSFESGRNVISVETKYTYLQENLMNIYCSSTGIVLDFTQEYALQPFIALLCGPVAIAFEKDPVCYVLVSGRLWKVAKFATYDDKVTPLYVLNKLVGTAPMLERTYWRQLRTVTSLKRIR